MLLIISLATEMGFSNIQSNLGSELLGETLKKARIVMVSYERRAILIFLFIFPLTFRL